MKINDRIFTYPVLFDGNKDYKESLFETNVECIKNGPSEVLINVSASLNNEAIIELIHEGQAEYVFHFECAQTSYREIIKSYKPSVEKHIPINCISKKLEVTVLVMTKMDVNNFNSTDFVDEISARKFDISKNSIMAYNCLPDIIISTDYEEFNNQDSIFTLYKITTNDDIPFRVDINNTKIRIGLQEKFFSMYQKLSYIPNYKNAVNSLIVLPVLVYIFSEIKIDTSEFETYEWFTALVNSYEKQKIDFYDQVDKKGAFVLAQEAMGLPIGKAMESILMYIQNTGE